MSTRSRGNDKTNVSADSYHSSSLDVRATSNVGMVNPGTATGGLEHGIVRSVSSPPWYRRDNAYIAFSYAMRESREIGGSSVTATAGSYQGRVAYPEASKSTSLDHYDHQSFATDHPDGLYDDTRAELHPLGREPWRLSRGLAPPSLEDTPADTMRHGIGSQFLDADLSDIEGMAAVMDVGTLPLRSHGHVTIPQPSETYLSGEEELMPGHDIDAGVLEMRRLQLAGHTASDRSV